jgi:hypothetical protein
VVAVVALLVLVPALAVLDVAVWVTVHAAGLVLLAVLAAVAVAVARRRARPAARPAVRTGPAPVQPAAPAATWPRAGSWTAGPDAQLAAERERSARHLAGIVAERDQASQRLTAVMAERDQLAARAVDLERQLLAAQDAAHAAWDASASVPPRPAPVRDDDARARLLADPLSGARPLAG